jgi:hypothetical protein
MKLFRRIRDLVNESVGFELKLIEDARETAQWVNSKSSGAVLLLTSCIEWFTQLHYLEAFKSDGSLDSFTLHIFKSHWLEESQHAQMGHLETQRAFSKMDEQQSDQAIADLIELVGGVDGLLQKQADYDVQNLEQYLARAFSDEEKTEIHDAVLAAKRYTFIMSGVTHPNFQAIFGAVTNEAQQEKVGEALRPLGALAAAGIS